MLPDKKSTSFTWLQGTRRSGGTATERMALNDENAMEIDSPKAAPLPAQLDDTSPTMTKENKPRTKVKKMTRMGASSLLRRAPTNSGLMYQYMEQDLPEEEDEAGVSGGDNGSDTSKGSVTSSFSIGRKLNKTIKDVRMSIGNLSQRLRKSTRRRYALGDSASAVDVVSPTRRILGRTPTKLYSPFGFDSPAGKTPNRRCPPMTPRLSRKASMPGPVRLYDSPMDKPKTPHRVGMRNTKNSPVTRQSFRF